MTKEHTQAIPDEVIQQVQQKIDEAIALIRPYGIVLSPVQRKSIPKMGEKTLSFVGKSLELAKQNPELAPRYLDMAALEIDYKDAHGLLKAIIGAKQLYQSISDTAMQAGSEAYQSALAFYNSVKIAAAQGVAGAKAVYEELRKRFVRVKHRDAGSDSDLSGSEV
ncbi:MAG: hypothetical protein LBR08_10720 [Bacteroidales bacterium]|jgi:hypothetical protein|nr:hypothetical protein [Bacteroidales bacterium]